ncbi:TetR/AcrR family transcriptional regulator [Naasia sp. SYSU D00948]|uniref:TetR/AcrR family transcriptional regulator n=1 Tax=Naasia sp. SYSU D00948 TaxID=2817379 RepID=UPI001B304CC0|nr:TetR/AcrR family transcriptional regulator [Naasia sp. SYSU D00948]
MTTAEDITEPKARATRPRGDARRQQILDTAMELFAGGGFHTVTLADVANRVGITQAGLLHHFPSKAELLLAVLQERDRRNDQESEEDRTRGDGPLDWFLAILERNERSPMLVQLMAILSAEALAEGHPGYDWFRDRQERSIRTVTRQLEPLLDESRLPDGVTAETVARWLIALADGARLQWLHNPRAVSRHGLVGQFVALLRPYLKDQDREPDV